MNKFVFIAITGYVAKNSIIESSWLNQITVLFLGLFTSSRLLRERREICYHWIFSLPRDYHATELVDELQQLRAAHILQVHDLL